MPNLKDIRKRIESVKSTAKITRAMKLVAAAKLRRAQANIENARPYAVKLHEMISELALRADEEDHPLLAVRVPNTGSAKNDAARRGVPKRHLNTPLARRGLDGNSRGGQRVHVARVVGATSPRPLPLRLCVHGRRNDVAPHQMEGPLSARDFAAYV